MFQKLKSKKHVVVIVALAILLIASVFLISHKFYKTSSTSNLITKEGVVEKKESKNVLSSEVMNLENIYLSGDSDIYSIQEGEVFSENNPNISIKKEKEEKIIRLAKFYRWMKVNPIFFSATINAEGTRKSINRIKETENKLIDFQGLKNKLYPADFLEKFIDASEAFDNFNKKISDKNAQLLIDKIKETQSSYLEDLEKLEKAVLEIEEKNPNSSTIVFLGGDTHTDMQLIGRDLEKMKKNVYLAEEEIKLREKCLNESADFCQLDSPKLELEETVRRKTTEGINKDPVLFTKAEINISKLVDQNQMGGPYKISSSCWGENPENYLYVAKICREDSGACLSLFYLANQIYYSSTPAGATERKLKEQGVEVFSQRATTPYACQDFEYYVKLEGMDYFYRNFRDENLLEEINNSGKLSLLSNNERETIKMGIEVEKYFWQEKYPSEESLEKIMNYYRYAYFAILESGLDFGEWEEKLLERITLWQEKTVNYDLLMNVFSDSLEHLINNLKASDRSTSISYIYSARVNYAFFYLNFSDAAWLSKDKPEYFKISERVPKTQGIFNYNEAVEKFGKEKLEEWAEMLEEALL